MIAVAAWVRRRWMTPENILFAWHIGLTLMLVWWAAILAYPQPTFTLSPSYAEFVRICPDERFWAVGYAFGALIGCVGCYAAWPPRARQGRRRAASVRMSAAVLIAFVHGMTAIFMFTGAPTGTGSGVYVLIMCSAYLLLRAEYERS